MDILHVDDDPLYRKIIKDILLDEFPGLSFSEAADADQFWAFTRNNRPKLILMDIRLSGVNGLHLTKRFKKMHPEVKIIILSGVTSQEYYAKAATEAGANKFFSKHYLEIEELIELVGSSFETQKDRRSSSQ